MPAHRIPNEVRWAQKTERADSGCLLYTAGLDDDGYGAFWDTEARRSVRAHQYAWFRVHGAYVPQLDHLCHTTECPGGRCIHRQCVEITHLAPAGTRENTLRGNAITAQHARKTHCKRGHEFTPENTAPAGRNGTGRACRTCANDAKRQRRHDVSSKNNSGLAEDEPRTTSSVVPWGTKSPGS